MPSLVIGVPGLWPSRFEPFKALAEHGYLVMPSSGLVVDVETKQPLPLFIDVYERDERMRAAFEAICPRPIDDATLAKIDEHTLTLYAGTEEPHSVELSLLVMRLAGALLDVGGLAVKVETAGVAHPAERWRELLALGIPELAAYHGLTIRNAAPDLDCVYSCGMQHLALPDAVVDGANAGHIELVDMFNKYLALQQPQLADGHTFALAEDAPRYRLHHEECTLFPAGDLFHNPFGTWRLTPALVKVPSSTKSKRKARKAKAKPRVSRKKARKKPRRR